LFLVVTSVALGAPELAPATLIAPIAPAPFAPDVSMPVKLTTVIDDCRSPDRARAAGRDHTIGARTNKEQAEGCHNEEHTADQIHHDSLNLSRFFGGSRTVTGGRSLRKQTRPKSVQTLRIRWSGFD
jgi:hypothetical protein